MEVKNIDNIIDILSTSPIRKHLKNNENNITLFEEERKYLDKIDDLIITNKNNLYNPLKAVVLGEVKAGKSTLINSILKKEVAYTNVLEATATIVEVKYQEDESIYIHYNDDSKIKIDSLKELDLLMDENRTNQEFFKEIKKVEIRTKTDRLKEITIVDTPGLNTITTENAERTDEYIKNADVILWVLNAHNLGQSDTIDKIEDVLCFGKQIIGIVNRMDEVDGDSSELLEYVEGEMGYIFEDVFVTSAKKAWDGYLENNNDKVEESNINNLYKYIINNIEKNSKGVKKESIEASILAQVRKDIYFHENTKKKLDTMLSKIEEDLNELKIFNSNIKEIAKNQMDEWLEIRFFEEERRILNNCKNKEEYNMLIKQYTDESYIKSLVDSQYNKVGNYIVNEWKNHTEEFIQKIPDKNIEFSIHIDGFGNESHEMIEYSDEVADGAKQGGLTAGAVGLGLAGYSAWLGPAATYVTIGSAVATFLPPLLIAGTVGGAVWNVLKKDKEKTIKYNQVDVLVKELKIAITQNIINDVVEKLKYSSDYYFEYSKGIIYELLNQCNTSKEEIEKINSELFYYIENIKVEMIEFV